MYIVYIYICVFYLSLVPQSSASSLRSTIPKLFKLATKLVAKVHPPTTKRKHQTHGMPNFLLSPDTCCKWTESEINLCHLVLAQQNMSNNRIYVLGSSTAFSGVKSFAWIVLGCPSGGGEKRLKGPYHPNSKCQCWRFLCGVAILWCCCNYAISASLCMCIPAILGGMLEGH